MEVGVRSGQVLVSPRICEVLTYSLQEPQWQLPAVELEIAFDPRINQQRVDVSHLHVQ